MNSNRSSQDHISQPSNDYNLRALVSSAGLVYDKRAAYIESVCGALTESRFGPGRSASIAICLSDTPKLEPAVFYEMSAGGPAPAYTVLPDHELARRYANDIIRREIAPPVAYRPNIYIRPPHVVDSQNHSRGSP